MTPPKIPPPLALIYIYGLIPILQPKIHLVAPNFAIPADNSASVSSP